MSGGIAADAVLDYVTFQILQDNRYIAFIHSNEEEEIVGHGLLNQLLDHLPSMKDQLAEAPSDYLKLELSENADKITWFTKATLTRFLHLVGSPGLEKSVNISNEISQLEETRKFHFSLYAKAEDGIVSSDNSKNELLRAMDTRISALMEDLVSTINSVAGETVTFQEMVDLHEFSKQFADVDMSNLFLKLIKTSQIVAPSENKKSQVPFISQDDHTDSTGGNSQLSESPYSVEAVKYIERQNSTESEEFGFSSEDEGPDTERSRTFIRSASPRRSASPMRRVQVGRSGPRRTPALTIKSLTSFPPARERISSHSDCKSEESEELDKRTEVNVTRISVQDAISLFEGKQKNEAVDNRNKRSFNGNSSVSTNKAVLRRWSSGMGEPQKSATPSVAEQVVSEDKSELLKPEKGPDSENAVSETVEVELESETTNLNSDEVLASEPEFTVEKVGSDECSRQKEEELKEVEIKFVEQDHTDLKKSEIDSNKGCKSPVEKQKLKGQKPELRARKKKLPEKQEAEKSTVKANNDVGKKQSIRTRTQNVKKDEPLGLNSRKDSPKPAESKRISSRKTPSPQPAVRKSWPSTPSPRGTGMLHGKVQAGAVSSATKAPQKSPQLAAPPQKPQSSPRVERSQIQHKAVRKPQADAMKRLSKVEDGKNQAVPKDGKPMKVGTVKDTKEEAKKGTEIRNATPKVDGSRSPAKVVIGHKRLTKKSSVVPLEAKPSPSKDLVSPATSKAEETPAQVEETWSKGEDPISTMQHNAGAVMSDNGHVESERETQAEKANSSEEKEVSDETPCEGDDEVAERMAVSPAKIDPVQEPVISPAAWEESPHQHPSVSSLNISPNQDTEASSEVETKAHHSLSQMLVQESSEPDVIEWGNAENPPTIVYQKDAPKGFKRLLKFARKNKGETNGAAWASPYTSDGEDDGDECRTLGKRTSDSLLRKVAVPSKSPAAGAPYDSEPLSAQSNINNRSARSSNKFQEGHGTMKGARSFFSLSAFRGHKS